jgi:hypothetical protein
MLTLPVTSLSEVCLPPGICGSSGRDLASADASADVSVMLNDTENLGCATAEAQASELPVIAA